jgi:hypothetical protein
LKRLRYIGCYAVGDGSVRTERAVLTVKVVEKIDAQQEI